MKDECVGTSLCAGFVLSADAQELLAYRWCPHQSAEWNPDTSRMCITLPVSSVPFLDTLLQRALRDQWSLKVDRLLHGQCSTLGRFCVTDWTAPTVTLDVIPAEPAAPITVASVFAEWGLDVAYDAIQYPVGSTQTIPDATLYGVMHPELLAWCEPMNRFGLNCLVYFDNGYPARSRFTTARDLAKQYRYAVALVFGEPTDPEAPTAMAINCGLQVILFHPGDGLTRRVHFRRQADGSVCLCCGELGESE